jgi:fructose-1,6-bisphosphatase I
MAFIVEQAGGVAIDCHGNRIMDQAITKLHQKTSIAIGSPEIVKEMEEFLDRFKGQ